MSYGLLMHTHTFCYVLMLLCPMITYITDHYTKPHIDYTYYDDPIMKKTPFIR